MARKSNYTTTQADEPQEQLSTLPPELIEFVAECLTARDLLSFRSVCRSVYGAASRPYVRKYIATRPFLVFNEASLEKLTEMAGDQDRSRYMQCLNFSYASLLPPEEDRMSRERWLEIQGVASDSRNVRMRKREQRALHTKLWNREKKLGSGGHDSAAGLIALAIASFHERGINVGIKLTELGVKRHFAWAWKGSEEDPAPWGYDRLCDALGYRGCMDKRFEDYGAFFIIMLAVIQAEHAPPALEMGDLLNGAPIDLLSTLLYPSLEFDVFRNLETLQLSLTLCSWDDPWELEDVESAKEDVQDFQRCFVHALPSAPNLRNLSLTVLPHDVDELFLSPVVCLTLAIAVRIGKIAFPKLEVFKLEGHCIDPLELIEFLHPTRKTLRKLDLRYIRAQDSDIDGEAETEQLVEDQTASESWYNKISANLENALLVWHRVYDGEPWDRKTIGHLL